MYSKKIVGTRMKPWGVLTLTENFWEHFSPINTCSHLILRIKEIAWKEFLKFIKGHISQCDQQAHYLQVFQKFYPQQKKK